MVIQKAYYRLAAIFIILVALTNGSPSFIYPLGRCAAIATNRCAPFLLGSKLIDDRVHAKYSKYGLVHPK